MDVLIVDDEEPLAESITEYLRAFDLDAQYATTVATALTHISRDTPSVLVVDVNLPDGSGFDLCRRIRKTSQAPILFLSARGADDDQILGLGLGGDDYIHKPVSLAVLLAKVRRALDRTRTVTGFRDDHLTVDPATGRVFAAGEEVQLTGMEQGLLDHLVSRRGSVVSKEELLRDVWGSPMIGDGTVSVHMRRLRTKIEPDPDQPRYLRTVWGRGYLFDGP
ncbi:MAG: response regulator transcription factor [Brachybacterium sp.]|nr:response regulator transcription factor [Brachybacterium sp.]